ncbi:MAG: glycosyltransferase family 2 protein [Planctomycetes bacterium]|nr:glycosyltransferase family 2 protein [Planctomycetota bacterium]
MPDLSIIIPAYNEADRLPAFLRHVHEWAKADGREIEIIVVNDGSSDDTAQVAQQAGVRVISLERNSGKGAAVRRGMLEARGRLRLFADADGATQMTELAALERAVAGGAEIAIASREGRGTVIESSWLRRFLGRWFNRAVRMGSVKGIRDTQCGFKLFATPRAQALFEAAKENGFAFDVELLYLAQKWGIAITEVPVNWKEIAGSKVRLARDGWRMLKAVKRIRRRWRTGEYERPEPKQQPEAKTEATTGAQ